MISYFNSIKVRLEHREGTKECKEYINFNSIKVRLELPMPTGLAGDFVISIP